MISNESKKKLIEVVGGLDIQRGRLLLLHVGLRPIVELIGGSYRAAAVELLAVIEDLYQPINILIPTFTYTFTKSGIYHRYYSRSEVGRFGEEARRLYPQNRTMDPVFSVVDTRGKIANLHPMNWATAFGTGSLFEYLWGEDTVAINIGLPEFISTQLHYIECVHQLPYRYEKNFPGTVYSNETQHADVNYSYFVRKVDQSTEWDRDKIETDCMEAKIMNTQDVHGIHASCISAKALQRFLTPKIKNEETYLLMRG